MSPKVVSSSPYPPTIISPLREIRRRTIQKSMIKSAKDTEPKYAIYQAHHDAKHPFSSLALIDENMTETDAVIRCRDFSRENFCSWHHPIEFLLEMRGFAMLYEKQNDTATAMFLVDTTKQQDEVVISTNHAKGELLITGWNNFIYMPPKPFVVENDDDMSIQEAAMKIYQDEGKKGFCNLLNLGKRWIIFNQGKNWMRIIYRHSAEAYKNND